MAWGYRGYYGPMTITPQYGGQPGAVAVYQEVGCINLSTLYNDSALGAGALANPLPVSTDLNAVGHFVGVDVLGNVLFYAVPGWYFLKVNNAVFQIAVNPDPRDAGP